MNQLYIDCAVRPAAEITESKPIEPIGGILIDFSINISIALMKTTKYLNPNIVC